MGNNDKQTRLVYSHSPCLLSEVALWGAVVIHSVGQTALEESNSARLVVLDIASYYNSMLTTHRFFDPSCVPSLAHSSLLLETLTVSYYYEEGERFCTKV